MNVKSMRIEAVGNAILEIEEIMRDGVNVSALEAAKKVLMKLCGRSELFPRDEFPIPDADQTERTFLIHENPNGEYALYVNSGAPGQSSPPHDHGGSWAIVAAVDGEETHRLYVDETNANESAKIRKVADITVKPGTAVSMLPDGIHSIHAGHTPLLHLHLYGKGFPLQSERKEYDLEAGTVRRFVLEDIGFIEDAR